MNSDKEIFEGKKLSDLFEEIYNNSKETKTQVKGLIGELKPLIFHLRIRYLRLLLVSEYMEIGVKNDEHLIKLATVIQRLESAQARGSEGEMFDFSELQDLLDEQDEIKEEIQEVNEDSESSDKK